MGSKKPRNSTRAGKARSVPKPRRTPARPFPRPERDEVMAQFAKVRALLTCVQYALREVADPSSVDDVTAEPEQQVNRLADGVDACSVGLESALTMFGSAYNALDRVRP